MLEHSTYDDIVLTPASRDDTVNIPLRIGIFSKEGAPIPHFSHQRRTLLSSFPEFTAPESKISETCIYGGVVFDQYGHFITETLARFWFLRKHRMLPIVWHRFYKRPHWLPWQEEILRILGLHERRHVFVDSSIRVERVLLCEPGFVLFGYAQREHLIALAQHKTSNQPDKTKIWLSRRAAKDHGNTVNDEQFEDLIAQRGWIIFQPEKSSVSQQLEQFGSSARIAGIGGSAFHTLMLLRNVDAAIRIIPRFPYQMENFNYVASIRNFDQKGDYGLVERLSGEGSDAIVRIRSMSDTLDFIEG